MESWYTAAQLSGLPGLPGTDRGLQKLAERESWPSRKRAKGKGVEYPFSALPPEAQAALILRAAPKVERQPKAKRKAQALSDAWTRYDAATQKRRDAALAQAAALDAVQALVDQGKPKGVAQSMVAAQASVSTMTLWRQEAKVRGAARPDWPALLLDGHVGRTVCAAFCEAAKDFYTGMFLCRSRPTHAETYRRTLEVAAVRGWQVPSAKSVQRWLDDRYNMQEQAAARLGIEAAMRMQPSSSRNELVFMAGQAVNGDGLKFDEIWVRHPDGEAINTSTGWFYQDVRTRKCLAWRLGKTESTDLFRLATYDLTAICAPELMVVDNTRVAANLLMTAGADNRHRFGKRAEQGTGLLQMLGITTQFTNPDKEINNPGAKPVERMFGIGGIHSKVKNNPAIRAIGGYSQATAVPFDVFKKAVALEVQRHNAQVGRRSRAAGGVLSLDQAWEQSERWPRVLSEAQRRLLLMCREKVTVSSSTLQVTIAAGRSAHGANRYSADGLARYAGKVVYVHYDPEALHAGAHLYALDGRYLMALEHVPTHAFNSKAAGSEVGKLRQRTRKALKKVVKETQRMDAIERAQLYGEAMDEAPDTLVAVADNAPSKADGRVVQGHFERVPDPARDAARLTGEGQVLAGSFGVMPGQKVQADGAVIDMASGAVVQAAPADPEDISEEDQQFHDFIAAQVAAMKNSKW